jgi:hypothetical protein
MKCLECNKEFKYPNFKCAELPGNHKVESKLYVYGGSVNIQNIRDRRKFAPEVTLKADTEATAEDGTKIRTSRCCSLLGCRYTTENPEEQYYLENVAAKKFPIIWGPDAEETWRKNQLTPEQQTAIVQRRIEAGRTQTERDQRTLWLKVKSQRAG